MIRSSSSGLADFNPEPERTILRKLRKVKGSVQISPVRIGEENSESSTMADQNVNMDPPIPDDIQGVRPLNEVVPPEGNVNNVPNDPPARANPLVAPRTMMDYCRPNLDGANTSIARPRVGANHFELKPSVIQMIQQSVQFDGLSEEDPNSHLQYFLEMCDTFKIGGVSEDAVCL